MSRAPLQEKARTKRSRSRLASQVGRIRILRSRDGLAAALLLVLAVVLRVWTVSVLSRDVRIAEPILDGHYYLELARRLASGGGWPAEPYFMTPLYPSVLSVFFLLGAPTVRMVQVFQSLLGVVTLAILVLAARRDLGRKAAWSIAILYVLCGPVLAMESEVLTESLLLLLAAGAIWLWPRPGVGRLRAVLFGLISGLLMMGRGTFLLLALAALAYLLYATRPRRAALRPAAWVVLGIALTLPQMAAHQMRTTGHVHFVTLNGGLNLYLGNNPVSTGLYTNFPDIDIEADITGTRSASIAVGRPLTIEESSRYWRDKAFAFMRTQPGRALWLFGRKAMLYLSPREIPQLEVFDALRRSTLPLRVAFVDFAWILPLAVLGGMAAASAGRRRRRAKDGGEPAPFLVSWTSLIAIGWVSTIAFFATGRYRVPFLAGFFGLAALGLAELVRVIRDRRLRLGLAAIPLVVAIQWMLPSYPVQKAEDHDIFQSGARLSNAGRFEEALADFQEAIRRNPRSGASWRGAGYCLFKLGRAQESVEAFQKALAFAPGSAEAHANLAAAWWQLGRKQEAIAEFQTATRLDPYDPGYRANLVQALAGAGRSQEAATEARKGPSQQAAPQQISP